MTEPINAQRQLVAPATRSAARSKRSWDGDRSSTPAIVRINLRRKPFRTASAPLTGGTLIGALARDQSGVRPMTAQRRAARSASPTSRILTTAAVGFPGQRTREGRRRLSLLRRLNSESRRAVSISRWCSSWSCRASMRSVTYSGDPGSTRRMSRLTSRQAATTLSASFWYSNAVPSHPSPVPPESGAYDRGQAPSRKQARQDEPAANLIVFAMSRDILGLHPSPPHAQPN
jgi:hypothetical protein